MREMTLIGNMDDFLERAILNKIVLRIYNENGIAHLIVIVGVINVPIMNKIYVQYVNVEDEYLDEALDHYISIKDAEILFSHGVDIFIDDQDEIVYEEEADDNNDDDRYKHPNEDIKLKKEIESTKNAAKELNEAIDIAAESLFKAIFEPMLGKTVNKEKKNH